MSLAPDGSETPPTEGPALSTLPSSGRLLAVDWGERRIGLAVTDETQTLASPLATLTRRVGKRFPMPALQIHLDAQQPVGLLIGLPLDSSGNDGASAIEARDGRPAGPTHRPAAAALGRTDVDCPRPRGNS